MRFKLIVELIATADQIWGDAEHPDDPTAEDVEERLKGHESTQAFLAEHSGTVRVELEP